MGAFRPLGAGELIGFSWSVYRQRFGSLMAIGLILVGIPSLLQWLPGVGWLMTMVLLLTELLATGAFIRMIASHCVDLQIPAVESIRASWQRFGRMLGMWLIFVLGVVVTAMVMITIGAVILAVVAPEMIERLNDYADNPLASTPPRELFPLLIWTFVMVLPALALAILWWTGPMAVMIEGAGPVAALRRSWNLVMPFFGRTVGVFLLSLLLLAPPAAVFYWLLPQYLAAMAVGLWSVPLTSVIGTVLYLDLRARSEDLTHETLTEQLSFDD